MIGNARQHVSEPGAWIDIVQFGGDDQRIHRRGPIATTVGTREQPSAGRPRAKQLVMALFYGEMLL